VKESFKDELLEIAWTSFSSMRRSDLRLDYDQFCLDQAHWLDDYVLFRALKARYGGAYYLDWPGEFVRREPAPLARARRDLAEPKVWKATGAGAAPRKCCRRQSWIGCLA
jgi:4-alpha-glucanotransferase